MAGTPVKSCSRTRAGVNAISLVGSAFGSQLASASMSSALTATPSSLRSRFSSRILSEKANVYSSSVGFAAQRLFDHPAAGPW